MGWLLQVLAKDFAGTSRVGIYTYFQSSFELKMKTFQEGTNIRRGHDSCDVFWCVPSYD